MRFPLKNAFQPKRESYQVWFPGTACWELWYITHSDEPKLLTTETEERKLKFLNRPGKRVLALPSKQLTCEIRQLDAKNETELLTQARTLSDSDRHDVDGKVGVQPIAGKPPETTVRIDQLNKQNQDHALARRIFPDEVVPAASLLPIPAGSAAVWTELGDLIAGVERNGLTLTYLSIPGNDENVLPVKLSVLITDMKTEALNPSIHHVKIWNKGDTKSIRALTKLKVSKEERPAPINRHYQSGLKPATDSPDSKTLLLDHLRKRLSFQEWIAVCIAAALLLTTIGSQLFSSIQLAQQKTEIELLEQETAPVAEKKAQYLELSPAIDGSTSVLEAWRTIVTLPGADQIQLDHMAFARNGLAITGYASSHSEARYFIQELLDCQFFAALDWSVMRPVSTSDGNVYFEVKGNSEE